MVETQVYRDDEVSLFTESLQVTIIQAHLEIPHPEHISILLISVTDILHNTLWHIAQHASHKYPPVRVDGDSLLLIRCIQYPTAVCSCQWS